jgi:hypothetical protein
VVEQVFKVASHGFHDGGHAILSGQARLQQTIPE